MRFKKLIRMALLLTLLGLTSCTTSPLFLRSVDFMTPRVESRIFGGHAGIAINSVPTAIQMFEGGANTPVKELRLYDSRTIPTGFLDLGLTVVPHLEIFYLDQGTGIKWQFLSGDDSANKKWIAAVKAGTVHVKYSSSNGASSVNYNVSGNETGISLGYQNERLLPYVSYVRRFYDAKSNSSAGSRDDKGAHSTSALGIDYQFNDLVNSAGLGRPSMILELSHTHILWSNLSEHEINYGLIFKLHW